MTDIALITTTIGTADVLRAYRWIEGQVAKEAACV